MSQSTLMALIEQFLRDPQEGLGARVALAALTAPRAMLVDHLVDYSALHNSTVIEVMQPVVIQEGQFQGAVTSGLVATAEILERTPYVP
jgi:hypothetical protein